MKKTVKIILLLLISSNCFSQNFCDTYNWLWYGSSVENNPENWKFISVGGTPLYMHCPWTGPSRNVPDINKIISKEDYLPKNGWILLFKDFGCSGGLNYPYFILYNKYRSKLRLFMYLYNVNLGNGSNGGIVTLQWNSSKTTSLLTHTNEISRATSLYHSSSALTDDIGTTILSGLGDYSWYNGKFFVADFDVAFDQKTPTKNGDIGWNDNHSIFFNVSKITNSSIDINGSMDWITQTYSGNINKNSIIPRVENGKTVKDYLKDVSKITKSIPGESDLKKVFGDQQTELIKYQENTDLTFGNTKLSDKYEFTLTQLNQGSDFVNFLLGVSKYTPFVGKYIDAAIGVFDFFSNKSNEITPTLVEMMPTISKGNLKLTGKITTEEPLEPIIIDLPGTNHVNQVYAPYYDCPLGVIGLEEQPTLKIRKWVENSQKRTFESTWRTVNAQENIGGRCIPRSYKVALYDGVSITENWKSINVDNDLKIAINAKANCTLIKCFASLVAKNRATTINGSKKPIYTLAKEQEIPIFSDAGVRYYDWYQLDEDYPCTKVFNSSPYLSSPDNYRWINKTYHYLNDGFYELNDLDSTGFFEISTPFVDIQNFKGTSITVREETDVYLKIYAILEANDPAVSKTPIVWSAKYSLTEPAEDNTTDTPYPFTRAQLKNSDITDSRRLSLISNTTITSGNYSNWGLETGGTVTANATSNITFEADNQISLNPGFSASAVGTSTFEAKTRTNGINVIESNYTPIENIVNDNYFADKDCYPNDNLQMSYLSGTNTLENLINEAVAAGRKQFEPQVFPTLTESRVNIMNAINEKESTTKLYVFNVMGEIVFTEVISTENYYFDISSQKPGLYIIKLENGNSIKTFKVIRK